jgi:hypothetical protein
MIIRGGLLTHDIGDVNKKMWDSEKPMLTFGAVVGLRTMKRADVTSILAFPIYDNSIIDIY